MLATSQQVTNVATLPGIVKASFAMPDAHWGYGFPIGGVAPFGHATELRIFIDEDLLSFDEVWADIAPYVAMVDEQAHDGVAMTFFEVITGMAYAAFADVHANPSRYGADPERIAVGGDSAGGNISAACAQRAARGLSPGSGGWPPT